MGDLRETLLFIEWIATFSYLELGLLNELKFITKKGKKKNPQERAYGVLYLSYFSMWVWKLFADYYAPNFEIRALFLFLGLICQLSLAISFVFLISTVKKNIRKVFPILILFLIFDILIFLNQLPLRVIQLFSISISFMFLLIFLYYLWNIFTNNELRKAFPFYFFIFFFSFGFLITGQFLVNDRAIELFGIEVRFLGDIFQIIGVFFLYSFLTFLPPFTEFDWTEKIHQITIMNKGGLHIYSKKFKMAEGRIDENILSGFMTTIQMMLEKMTMIKDVTVINREGVSVIMYPGNTITGIIFSSEELNSLKTLLKILVNKLETIYSIILKKWDGDLLVFKPIDKICNSIFNFKEN